jgi:hypothetical protein
MTAAKRGRGRPKKHFSFFRSPEAEAKRLTNPLPQRKPTALHMRVGEWLVEEKERVTVVWGVGPYVSLDLAARMESVGPAGLCGLEHRMFDEGNLQEFHRRKAASDAKAIQEYREALAKRGKLAECGKDNRGVQRRSRVRNLIEANGDLFAKRDKRGLAWVLKELKRAWREKGDGGKMPTFSAFYLCMAKKDSS